jgi:hypothetical protein
MPLVAFGWLFEHARAGMMRVLRLRDDGEAPREIVAGEAFWEPGGDVVHYQVANLEPEAWSRFVAVCLCAPGVDMITMLEPAEIAARDHLRHPSARQNRTSS